MITPQTIFNQIKETQITEGPSVHIVRINHMEGLTTYRIYMVFGICVDVSKSGEANYFIDPIWGNIDLDTLSRIIDLTNNYNKAVQTQHSQPKL